MAKRRLNKRTAQGEQGTPPEPDVRRAFELVMNLMAIPGKSGEERRVSDFIVKELRAAGAPAAAIHVDSANRRTPIRGDTGNLILKLPGTRREPRRMLTAHLDTVPICVGSKPVRTNNLVRSADPNTGLGADNRAGCATILTAAREILKRELPHPPLTFCWFVQEENGLQGARVASKSSFGNPKLAFNWDGGSPTKLTIGATGGYRLQIDIQGLASHAGGAPEWGVSAIAIASLAISDLHENGWHGDIRKGKSRGTSNVGVIQGGDATNVVTDRVTVRAEARSHDPKFRERIVSEIRKAFERAAKKVRNVAGAHGEAKVDGKLDYESFKLDLDEPCVLAAGDAIRSLGYDPEFAIANGGVDANWLSARGIPTVTIGCGQLNQHMTSEALDVEQFEIACKLALRLATASESR